MQIADMIIRMSLCEQSSSSDFLTGDFHQCPDPSDRMTDRNPLVEL